jgi:hypothetical protein
VEVEVGHIDHGVPHLDVPGLGVQARLMARHHVPGDVLVARRGEPVIAAGQPSLIVVEPGRPVLFTVVSGERDMRRSLLFMDHAAGIPGIWSPSSFRVEGAAVSLVSHDHFRNIHIIAR